MRHPMTTTVRDTVEMPMHGLGIGIGPNPDDLPEGFKD
jgi:hypothetical protein